MLALVVKSNKLSNDRGRGKMVLLCGMVLVIAVPMWTGDIIGFYSVLIRWPYERGKVLGHNLFHKGNHPDKWLIFCVNGGRHVYHFLKNQFCYFHSVENAVYFE